ncbi:MAG: nucleoside hydrolase [Rhodobacterales bacterium]|nr:nucleoside hydrolase [Rhodobacterales bacterium]
MQKIIINCDSGITDALTNLLAVASRDDIDVLGRTCFKGNVALNQTHLNAQTIYAAALRLDIPALQGLTLPILISTNHEACTHGEDGSGANGFPLHGQLPESEMNSVDFILRQSAKYHGEVALSAIGPMYRNSRSNGELRCDDATGSLWPILCTNLPPETITLTAARAL